MPSQPSRKTVATWQVHGPGLLSREQVSGEQDIGFLGIDYTDNVDTRWPGRMALGPQINVVTLSTHDGANTPANVVGFALSHEMNATKFIYAIRGIPVAKIDASDLSLVDPGTVIALSADATDIHYTKNAAGTEMISIAQGSANAYENITAVGNAGVADTTSPNDETQALQIIGDIGGNADEPRVGGLVGSEFLQNVISPTNDMDNSNWESRAKVPEDVTPTGLAMDGYFVLLGTDRGPYFLDNEFQEYQMEMPEFALSPDSRNCQNMRAWNMSGLGVLIPMAGGLRFQKGLQGFSIGPEVFDTFDGPVQGWVTALAFSGKWGYAAVYNEPDDVTYIVAFRPAEGKVWHRHLVSYYPIAKLGASVECEAMEFIGRYGGRANDTLIGGNDSNMWWLTVGRLTVEVDDANYRFALAGTAHLTEMRRFPAYKKRVVALEFETADCDADDTVTVSVSVDGKTAKQVGAAVASNGPQRLYVGRDDRLEGWRLKPEIAFAASAATSSPKVVSPLRIWYEILPSDIDNRVFE